MRRAATLAAWLMALVLVAATFVTGRVQAQDKAGPDASITRQVELVLAKDPALRNMHIKVETQEGVVNLTGFVRSLEDIAKAAELARGVSGVSSVRNGLQVANRPSRG